MNEIIIEGFDVNALDAFRKSAAFQALVEPSDQAVVTTCSVPNVVREGRSGETGKLFRVFVRDPNAAPAASKLYRLDDAGVPVQRARELPLQAA